LLHVLTEVLAVWYAFTLFGHEGMPLRKRFLMPAHMGFFVAHAPRPAIDSLALLADTTLISGAGLKSLSSSPDGRFVYACNLEGCSVLQVDVASKRLVRRIDFKQSDAQGFNYFLRTIIESIAEKPVESCTSHGGKYVWVSLHNAGGVVAWAPGRSTDVAGAQTRQVTQTDYVDAQGRPFGKPKTTIKNLLFIPTGQTPKVLAYAAPYVFVANWHGNTVSVLDVGDSLPRHWRKVADMPAGPTPRGMAISTNEMELLVCNMAGASLSRYSIDSLKKMGSYATLYNPRHVVAADSSVYVTINSGARLQRLDAATGKTKASVLTGAEPRTLALSPDGRLALVACYGAERAELYALPALKRIATLPCKGKPVAGCLFETDSTYEAWVGTYLGGNIRVFSLKEVAKAPVVQRISPKNL